MQVSRKMKYPVGIGIIAILALLFPTMARAGDGLENLAKYDIFGLTSTLLQTADKIVTVSSQLKDKVNQLEQKMALAKKENDLLGQQMVLNDATQAQLDLQQNYNNKGRDLMTTLLGLEQQTLQLTKSLNDYGYTATQDVITTGTELTSLQRTALGAQQVSQQLDNKVDVLNDQLTQAVKNFKYLGLVNKLFGNNASDPLGSLGSSLGSLGSLGSGSKTGGSPLPSPSGGNGSLIPGLPLPTIPGLNLFQSGGK